MCGESIGPRLRSASPTGWRFPCSRSFSTPMDSPRVTLEAWLSFLGRHCHLVPGDGPHHRALRRKTDTDRMLLWLCRDRDRVSFSRQLRVGRPGAILRRRVLCGDLDRLRVDAAVTRGRTEQGFHDEPVCRGHRDRLRAGPGNRLGAHAAGPLGNRIHRRGPALYPCRRLPTHAPRPGQGEAPGPAVRASRPRGAKGVSSKALT